MNSPIIKCYFINTCTVDIILCEQDVGHVRTFMHSKLSPYTECRTSLRSKYVVRYFKSDKKLVQFTDTIQALVVIFPIVCYLLIKTTFVYILTLTLMDLQSYMH